MERNVLQTQQLMRTVRDRAMEPIRRTLEGTGLAAGGVVFAHPGAPSAAVKPPPSPPQPPKAAPKPAPASPVPKPKPPRAAARDFSHLQGQTMAFQPTPAAGVAPIADKAVCRIADGVIAAYRATGRSGLKS